jgi:hypothetical protein
MSEKALKSDRLFLIGDVAPGEKHKTSINSSWTRNEAAMSVYLKNWNKL